MNLRPSGYEPVALEYVCITRAYIRYIMAFSSDIFLSIMYIYYIPHQIHRALAVEIAVRNRVGVVIVNLVGTLK